MVLNSCNIFIIMPTFLLAFCFGSLFCYSVLSVLSIFDHLDGEDRAGCFTLIVFLVSCHCLFL